MPLKPDRLERSLNLARKTLSEYETSLDKDGVSADLRKKSPRWRALNAQCRQIEQRIQASQDLITRGERPQETSEEAA